MNRLIRALLFAFLIGPFLVLVLASLGFRWHWPEIIPSQFFWQSTARGPSGWAYLLSPSSRFAEAALNSGIIAFSVAILVVLIGVPAAWAIARQPRLAWLITLPLLLPEIALSFVLFMVFLRLGLSGSLGGIILAHLVLALPYAMRVFIAMFQRFDLRLIDAAALLGASRIQILRHVVLPYLGPSLLIGALFAFLVSSSIFLISFMIGQGRILTLPTLIFARVRGGAIDPSSAALVLAAAIPAVALALLLAALMARER